MRPKITVALLTLLFVPLLLVQNTHAEDGNQDITPSVAVTISAVPSSSPAVTGSESENRARGGRVPDAIITMRAKIKSEREQIMNDLKSKMTASHEAIKAEIMKIRDQRKQETVERINTSISEKNKKITDNFSHMLEIMTKQLNELQTNIDAHKKTVASSDTFNAAVSKANASIEAAQKAVDTQAAKTYTITIQSDQTVKTDVASVVTQFKADLKGVLSLVRAARMDVLNARKIARANSEPKISVSPKPSEMPEEPLSPVPSESPEVSPSPSETPAQ